MKKSALSAADFLAAIARAQSGPHSKVACEFKDVRIVGNVDFGNLHVNHLSLENVTFEGRVTGLVEVDTLRVHAPMCIFYSSFPSLYAGGLIKDFTS